MHDFGPSSAATIRMPGNGDADSEFEAIFLEHYARVLRILRHLTGSPAQAEELANDVFWRLSRKPTSWLLTNNVGGWLYRSATHAGIDALRAAGHRVRYEHAAGRNADQDDAHTPLHDLLRAEDRQQVQTVLSRMRPAQAQLLVMRAAGASYKELADALNVATGSIGTLLNRAEAEFRKRYLKLTRKERVNELLK